MDDDVLFKYFVHILLFYINIAICIPLLKDVDRPCYGISYSIFLFGIFEVKVGTYVFERFFEQ